LGNIAKIRKQRREIFSLVAVVVTAVRVCHTAFEAGVTDCKPHASILVLWWKPFFTQPWKVFDFLIVLSSLLALTPYVDIPNEVRPVPPPPNFALLVSAHH
jgi:hypothetical protein